ncbi:hypothetical protein E1193_03155 [Micromonospora sp. KC606]|uniref:hypothetical protein n=1 Tax=Micromonospora sp. KC606 TaxID=2530379 RepID=UPI001051B465|nr:hypothetical protein [Micromonospora sp. KC606]TDC85309.1 hypothetical protein E1193_03155 [Micromonospora sp. KC606]
MGDVLTVQPWDYVYGDVVLRLKVTHVPSNADLLSLEWVRLFGIELRPDGSPWRERDALIRVGAIRANPPARDGVENVGRLR